MTLGTSDTANARRDMASQRAFCVSLRFVLEDRKSRLKSLVHDEREQVRPKAQQYQQEETVLDGYGGNL